MLLTAGIVHARTASSLRPRPNVLSLSLSCAIARSCHRRQTAGNGRLSARDVGPVLCGPTSPRARNIWPCAPGHPAAPKAAGGLDNAPRDLPQLLRCVEPARPPSSPPLARAREPCHHARRSYDSPSVSGSVVMQPDPAPDGRFVPESFRKPARNQRNLRASDSCLWASCNAEIYAFAGQKSAR